ncbi:MAG: hypothetical protein WAU14_04515, partial [Dokdonella sp.]|uniref:hypothetical protein n=1 Tax=Dokdonella sp. TaxID=2291710 RepID=UPI003BAF7A81
MALIFIRPDEIHQDMVAANRRDGHETKENASMRKTPKGMKNPAAGKAGSKKNTKSKLPPWMPESASSAAKPGQRGGAAAKSAHG